MWIYRIAFPNALLLQRDCSWRELQVLETTLVKPDRYGHLYWGSFGLKLCNLLSWEGRNSGCFLTLIKLAKFWPMIFPFKASHSLSSSLEWLVLNLPRLVDNLFSSSSHSHHIIFPIFLIFLFAIPHAILCAILQFSASFVKFLAWHRLTSAGELFLVLSNFSSSVDVV